MKTIAAVIIETTEVILVQINNSKLPVIKGNSTISKEIIITRASNPKRHKISHKTTSLGQAFKILQVDIISPNNSVKIRFCRHHNNSSLLMIKIRAIMVVKISISWFLLYSQIFKVWQSNLTLLNKKFQKMLKVLVSLIKLTITHKLYCKTFWVLWETLFSRLKITISSQTVNILVRKMISIEIRLRLTVS